MKKVRFYKISGKIDKIPVSFSETDYIDIPFVDKLATELDYDTVTEVGLQLSTILSRFGTTNSTRSNYIAKAYASDDGTEDIVRLYFGGYYSSSFNLGGGTNKISSSWGVTPEYAYFVVAKSSTGGYMFVSTHKYSTYTYVSCFPDNETDAPTEIAFAPSVTSITISSSSPDSIICGMNISLSVIVEGTGEYDPSLTYTLEGVTSTNTTLTKVEDSEGNDFILNCGADEKAETLTITFTSVQDPTFTATKTITVQQVPTVIFDLRSWLMGFTLGIAGKPLPFGRALWYSYNGTILNALPYWDESKYPYAVITSFTILDTTAYKLWLFEEPMMAYSVEGSDLPTFRAGDTDVQYMMDTCKIGYSDSGSNKWEGLKNMTITANSDATTGAIVWSNYDITLEEGTVYMAASEPVPYCGKMVEPEQPSGGQDDLFPIEWNNQVIKNNTSIELEGLQLFKISDSIPTSDELTNLRIIAFNDEERYSFAFYSIENIGSMNLFIYTLSSLSLFILSVSENTDGYEPGLYVTDFGEINVNFTMYYAPLTFYLYNGVKMPDIETVWVDKQKYPYAFMNTGATDNGAIAWLYLTANPVRINTSELSGLLIPEGGFVQYICTTDPNVVSLVVGYNYWKDNMMTGENDMSFDAPEESGIAWANYDVFNTDGTLYLAASEPVPVYE